MNNDDPNGSTCSSIVNHYDSKGCCGCPAGLDICSGRGALRPDHVLNAETNHTCKKVADFHMNNEDPNGSICSSIVNHYDSKGCCGCPAGLDICSGRGALRPDHVLNAETNHTCGKVADFHMNNEDPNGSICSSIVDHYDSKGCCGCPAGLDICSGRGALRPYHVLNAETNHTCGKVADFHMNNEDPNGSICSSIVDHYDSTFAGCAVLITYSMPS